jgi:membrane fusion protein (multidrug efflux system)
LQNLTPRSQFFVLTGLVCALLIGGCGSKSDANTQQGQAKPAPQQQGAQAPAAPKPMGLPVKAEPVKVAKVADEISAVGSLLAEESVIIRPEIDGRIVGLHFQEGQPVSAGQRLVTIDSSEYEAQMAAIQADLRTEQQRLARSQELFEQKFISKDALDVQRGGVDRLQARVDEAKTRVAKTVIRAPFSGVVGLRLVSPGAYVKAGDDIVRLENISSIKADFRVPEVFLGRVKPSQEVAVRLDAFPNEEFRGKVYAVQPVVDENTRTVLMRARIPNRGFKLKPGMFVRVAVTTETRPNAIIVPEQAIWPQGQDNFVFRVVDGKAALTKIQIGNRQPGAVEIASGLGPDDVVVTEGQIKLRDGAPVMVMGAPPAAAPAGGAAPTQQAQGEKKAS